MTYFGPESKMQICKLRARVCHNRLSKRLLYVDTGTHFWGWEKEKVLLCFAAAILLLGHWQRILWALSTLSLSQLSTVAAVACVAAAAYIHVAAHLKGWTMRVQEAWDQVRSALVDP